MLGDLKAGEFHRRHATPQVGAFQAFTEFGRSGRRVPIEVTSDETDEKFLRENQVQSLQYKTLAPKGEHRVTGHFNYLASVC